MMIQQHKTFTLSLITASMLALAGCGGSDSSTPKVTPKQETPADKADFATFHKASPVTIKAAPTGVTTYAFTSKFDPAKSAVSYTGQTARHALIDDMSRKFKSYEEGKGATIDADMKVFMDGPTESVNYVLGKIAGKVKSPQTLIPGPTYGDISKNKKIKNKIAGNDPKALAMTFTGWQGVKTPEALVYTYIDLLKAQVNDGKSPTIATKTGNAQIDVTYVDDKGRDLNQLVQKYLLMAVTFSQGTADYLKTDFVSKNTQDKGTKPYTAAEHKWDEGFGYFGASRDYGALSDADIKGKVISDANGDNRIDLRSEVNQGAAVNCAKRDAGSKTNTNFTKQAFDAFLSGRKVLNDAANSAVDLTASKQQLDAAAKQASFVWEQCIAATVVHYVNDTNGDLDKFIKNGGKFDDLAAYKKLAKHWSEMKGFAIGLQFNPDSPFNSSAKNQAAFAYMVNDLMGDQPDFSSVDKAKAYQKKLMQARDLLQAAYKFDKADVENW